MSVLCVDGVKARPIPELTVSNDTIETCVVQIYHKNEKFVVFAVYKPHSDTIESSNSVIGAMLQSEVLRGTEVILIGDINIDLLKYNSNYIAEFINTMHSVTFTPVITKATRFPPGNSPGSPSLLDQIWTNRLGIFTGGIVLIDTTDHCPIFINVPTTTEIDNKVKLTFRIHSTTYINNFKIDVESILDGLDFNQNVNSITSKLITDLESAYVKCFPLSVKYVSPKRLHKQWITTGILNSIKTKSRYFKLYKLGLIDEELNRKYRNCLKSTIRQAKKYHFRTKFESSKNNIKKIIEINKATTRAKI